MAEWNLKYEKDIKIPDKEKNYFLKTINDFVELNNEEMGILKQILQKISECEVGDKIKTVDLGFWDKNGEYKEDIQTVDITKE